MKDTSLILRQNEEQLTHDEKIDIAVKAFLERLFEEFSYPKCFFRKEATKCNV